MKLAEISLKLMAVKMHIVYLADYSQFPYSAIVPWVMMVLYLYLLLPCELADALII